MASIRCHQTMRLLEKELWLSSHTPSAGLKKGSASVYQLTRYILLPRPPALKILLAEKSLLWFTHIFWCGKSNCPFCFGMASQITKHELEGISKISLLKNPLVQYVLNRTAVCISQDLSRSSQLNLSGIHLPGFQWHFLIWLLLFLFLLFSPLKMSPGKIHLQRDKGGVST